MPRFLLVNPNTDSHLTQAIVAMAQKVQPECQFAGATARFGAEYIASPDAVSIAADAVYEIVDALSVGTYDAVIIACFGDPGVALCRRHASIPVVGLAEQSFASCRRLGGRFSVLTGGEAWRSMIEKLAETTGYRDDLASVRTIPTFGKRAQAERQKTLDALVEAGRRAISDDRADRLLIGGTGLAGFHRDVQEKLPVPVHCSLLECLSFTRDSAEHSGLRIFARA